MLVPCTGPTTAIFIVPLFFGVANFHHVIEQLHLKEDTLAVILLSARKANSYRSLETRHV
ncbi:unnamed protein product [Oncorhynchus mykiss]|uniref:Uncharacterized protein n=1 Tax=Oncorhynchus mykiss TaxID=8022 RepID=A0A060X3C5_ONCMY|nr:unnamed protein product [Oncorhynchus mykiss]